MLLSACENKGFSKKVVAEVWKFSLGYICTWKENPCWLFARKVVGPAMAAAYGNAYGMAGGAAPSGGAGGGALGQGQGLGPGHGPLSTLAKPPRKRRSRSAASGH
jgi:hypothetical protein